MACLLNYNTITTSRTSRSFFQLSKKRRRAGRTRMIQSTKQTINFLTHALLSTSCTALYPCHVYHGVLTVRVLSRSTSGSRKIPYFTTPWSTWSTCRDKNVKSRFLDSALNLPDTTVYIDYSSCIYTAYRRTDTVQHPRGDKMK